MRGGNEGEGKGKTRNREMKMRGVNRGRSSKKEGTDGLVTGGKGGERET